MTTASQVIMTNTAFMLQQQLEEAIKENNQLQAKIEKLLAKIESIENYANELGEEIFNANSNNGAIS